MDFPLFWWKYQFVGKNMHKRKHFCTNTLFWPKYPINRCFFLTMAIQIGKAPLRPKIVKFQMFICSMCVPFNKYRRRSHHHIWFDSWEGKTNRTNVQEILPPMKYSNSGRKYVGYSSAIDFHAKCELRDQRAINVKVCRQLTWPLSLSLTNIFLFLFQIYFYF